MIKTIQIRRSGRAMLMACGLAATLATTAGASSESIKQPLAATGADADAFGDAKVKVRNRAGELSGKLDVRGRRLDPLTTYQVTVDGVLIGTFQTRSSGTGRVRFRTEPRVGDELLGVDPRGREIRVLDAAGAVVLQAAVPTGSLDPDDVRCCLPDDSGVECEDRTAAECAALGGVDMGPGSCLPNPCDQGTPPDPADDVVCCLPDDSGPECEDRTAAECAAQGGINLGAGSCVPDNPCPPLGPEPDDDIRCCLPDDSGPECEDRTAAECELQGGVNIGPGVCGLENPCLSGATTTTLPGATTTTTLPPNPVLVFTCERRADRSRASVNGKNLAAGNYRARLTSGANTATTGLAPTVLDEVEHDFDSDPADIAAGATAIAASFLVGTPPQATGELLDAGGNVVLSATITCLEN